MNAKLFFAFTFSFFLTQTPPAYGMEHNTAPANHWDVLRAENNQLNFLYWAADVSKLLHQIKKYEARASYEGTTVPFEEEITSPQALAFVLKNKKNITLEPTNLKNTWGTKKYKATYIKIGRSQLTKAQQKNLKIDIAKAQKKMDDAELRNMVSYFNAIYYSEKLRTKKTENKSERKVKKEETWVKRVGKLK